MRKIIYWLLAFLVLAFLAVFFIFKYRSQAVLDFLARQTADTLLSSQISSSTSQSSADLWLDMLGFNGKKNFLVLFENNTELRPGGGFIGSYAVISADHGQPDLIKIEGTEILDNSGPADKLSSPPDPLRRYLKVDKLFFRDSNWSPDFAISASSVLAAYRAENGVLANEIDYVIAITPTVMENILRLTGPIAVDDLNFTAENFTEQLEYEVEYGFAKKGISFADRKKILNDLSVALIKKIGIQMLLQGRDYWRVLNDMVAEKQMMFFSPHAERQSALQAAGLSGVMSNASGDYLLWVDANLGALKTDLAVERSLSYQIFSTSSGRFAARAAMRYNHNGQFDWRTSRYRSYARVYVPIGSSLVSVAGAMATDKSAEPGKVDSGVENGRAWFGTFISVEPGTKKELVFTYLLPEKISTEIALGAYGLNVQKQLGALSRELTLDLDFGKKLQWASVPEESAQFYDNSYRVSTDLITDRVFQVRFE